MEPKDQNEAEETPETETDMPKEEISTTDMRAKFTVRNVEEIKYGPDGAKSAEVLTFGAVCGGGHDEFDEEGRSENNTYALFTPCADLSMTVNNPALWGKFKVGMEVYGDFTIATMPQTDEGDQSK